MNANCPSCGSALPKMPTRKTKCKTCGQFMYVKSTPDNREKRLMTEAEAEAAERLWAAHYERQRAEQLATGSVSKPELMTLAANPAADRQQRKMAALQLGGLAETQEERESWCVLAYAMELEMMAAGGVVPKVMIRGEVERCPVCARLDQQVMNIERAMSEMPLPPRDCPGIADGRGCLCWYWAVIPGWRQS